MGATNRLKELRQASNLSQKDFFEKIVKGKLKLGVTLRTYQNWENPNNEIKSRPAQALADHFGVSVGYLLGFEDNLKEALKNLTNSEEYETDYYKAFRAHYELKVADGQENFFNLKDESYYEKLRQSILLSLIPNFKDFSAKELEKKLLDRKLLTEAEYKLSDFFFSLGTLPADEVELLTNFIFLSTEDKLNIQNIVKSLSQK
ncbi:TPA: helix-turn-helix transcriptional regulator [Streptococcus suis]|uniref:Phage transcriptional regulator, Cro/CI family n=1 Tax=Streptococcus suis TaxID=1307 RepID=A0A116Q218_STRSU|nr:helix-turn-helix transcriptional regulator [Streptococcus suis]MDW8726684.1 helix-turn-helix transcriptional regulator [Streptococcus suis]NQI84488.1 helix-turn-helix transcriptional regulator [Streptococcus suis]NQK17913.1 helix-turn-helix transcriptional regulator [Streptococcus suis]NQN59403.1 helix-turn-helix transcriptional regulator [Streptococcus suis]NQP74692.1 helix-turn-helix transcriptional regulator [Streptococcus suis]